MTFIDEVVIKVTSGSGGNGIVAFRREKYVPLGGPAGGTGGNGGDIVFIGDEGINTLLDLRYNKHIKGKNGENGVSKSKDGKNADTVYIKVPLGTSIFDSESNMLIGDITKYNEEVVIVKGGRGGRGNVDMATSKNPAPEICEKGEPGKVKHIRVELKVLADCGLVGYPSVGKSTLISAVTASRPKIASYHFTTLTPNLGVVGVKDGRSFVIADLPGLIAGASQGVGLGFQFLRHIERCRVIVHIIDMSGSEGRVPYEDYLAIIKELDEYKYNLLARPHIVVANKMDLPSSKENIKDFKKKYKEEVIEISAYTNKGLDELLYKIADILDKTPEFPLYEEGDYIMQYNFEKADSPYKIELIDSVYVVSGVGLKKLFDMTDFSSQDGAKRFSRQIRSMGIDEDLRKLGVKNGDTVKIFEYQFEFID